MPPSCNAPVPASTTDPSNDRRSSGESLRVVPVTAEGGRSAFKNGQWSQTSTDDDDDDDEDADDDDDDDAIDGGGNDADEDKDDEDDSNADEDN